MRWAKLLSGACPSAGPASQANVKWSPNKVEEMWAFIDEMYAAPGLVWTIAFMMSVVAAWMFHHILEDFLRTMVVSVIMYWAMVATNVAVLRMGIIFSADKEANIVWASGVTICAVTAITVLLIRLSSFVMDGVRALRRGPEPAGPEYR